MSGPPAARFETVEAGRGIAAVLVVLFHASAGIFPAAKYWNARVFGGVFDFGYAGVDFFFVLSGFIIAHVHARDVGDRARLGHFAWRRFVRIYPVYWIVLAGLLLLLFLPIGVGDGTRPAASIVAASVVLAGPENAPTVLAVAWTLYHEVLFYVVFAAWIVSPRAGAVVTLVWAGLIAAAMLGAGVAAVPAYVASPLNLLFGLGIGAWYVSRRAWLPRPRIWAWFGALAFVALGLQSIYAPLLPYVALQLSFGLASAVAIAGFTTCERMAPMRVPWLLRELGAASYAIYLVHFPLLSLLATLSGVGGLRAAVPVPVAFVLVVVLTVVAGILFHRIVEKRLLRALTRRRAPA